MTHQTVTQKHFTGYVESGHQANNFTCFKK